MPYGHKRLLPKLRPPRLAAPGCCVAAERNPSRDASNRLKLASVQGPDEGTGAEQLFAPLGVIAAWAAAERGLCALSEAVVAARQETLVPSEVRDALRTLDMHDLAGIGQAFLDDYSAHAAFRRVRSLIDERSWAVFAERRLAAQLATPARSLDELGRGLGVSRERVRQLERGAEDTIRDAVVRRENAVLVRGAQALKNQGAVLRLDALGTEAELRNELEAEAGVPRLFLLWLAGPYRQTDGWLIFGTAAADTLALLDELTATGPVQFEDARPRLRELGLPDDLQLAWVAELGRHKVIDGKLVPWHGTLLDKAEVVLMLHGEPMTPEALHEAIPEATSARGLVGRIQSDSRFLRRGLKHYGLAAWGGEEYTTIADEIEEEIERQGGAASLEHLVEVLPQTFGVSAGSVQSYALGPRFERGGDGLIRMRSRPADLGAHARIEETKRCYRLPTGWAYRVTVTSETLRGSGCPLPFGVAGHLELRPGEQVVLTSQSGEVRFSWPNIQPAIGSIRRIAEAAAAAEGDYLFLVFLPGHKLDVQLVRAADRDGASGLARLRLEVGSTQDADDPRAAVAAALGLEVGAGATEIRRRLRARGEEELADLMPHDEAPAADDATLQALADLGG